MAWMEPICVGPRGRVNSRCSVNVLRVPTLRKVLFGLEALEKGRDTEKNKSKIADWVLREKE